MTAAFSLLAVTAAALVPTGLVTSLNLIQTAPPATQRAFSPSMGLFDSLKGAFANDDTLGARSNAGLSKEVTKRTITWIGPSGNEKKSIVVPGQRLRDIARGSGIPIKYDCTEGSCKTCEAQMGNSRVKICVAKAVDKDITIKYGLRQKN
mmetsp:Transcript_5680/g.17697  ORF Transcript_5680/g.17697 Transcript_5680/m.17697 type:complete len:150 (-) Transcript_5680:544-993(-)|eukprot:scaffold111967_cov39-Tisochrysis_lutea.AAC.1